MDPGHSHWQVDAYLLYHQGSLPFHFVIVSFAGQKFFSLMESHLFIFAFGVGVKILCKLFYFIVFLICIFLMSKDIDDLFIVLFMP